MPLLLYIYASGLTLAPSNPLNFFDMRLLDLLDIVLASVLMYQLYRLLRGSLALNIFIGILLFYLLHFVVQALEMKLMATIIGKFVEVGVIAVLIVFQPEIRRFLLFAGRAVGFGKNNFWRLFQQKIGSQKSVEEPSAEIMEAVYDFSAIRTGALLVFAHANDSNFYLGTGTLLNSEIKRILLESVFQKNSPLHDGAVFISDFKIVAAGCTLPVSENPDLPAEFGMRHKAAIGLTEKIDAHVIVVSEESGTISLVSGGAVRRNPSQQDLSNFIKNGLLYNFD
ncbi:MAG: TIGR00159 family protein [Sphingobacteriales bacterium]|nr:TIGR00159 family protein [Sphingobacteriales bacterium]